MALDVIKQYLVGIGFNVDAATLSNAKKSISEAEKSVKELAKNNSKELSAMGKSIKNTDNSLKSNLKTFTDLVPAARAPIGELSKYIGLFEKVVNKASQNTTKDMTKSTESIKALSTTGGEAITAFAGEATIAIAAVAAAVVALVATGVGLSKFLNKLAKEDLGYDKLARELWTTKENAKEIDMALKTMGVTMKDLWLSPELLKQFNQLRKDAANLKLPKEYSENLKIVRGIGFEFQRLKQLGSLTFQWIGHYILKYCAGPLADIRQSMRKFNDGLIKKIPSIAKVIGTALGIVFRVIVTIVEVLGVAFNLIGKVFNFIGKLLDKIPGPIKEIIKLIALIGVVIASGPIGAIIGLILVIDDLLTAIRGGKSAIGSFFGNLKEKANNSSKDIIKNYNKVKNSFKNGIRDMKTDWDYYWDKAKGVFEKLEDKARKTLARIKEWSKGLMDKAKDKMADLNIKVKDFSAKVNVNHSMPTGYLVPNSNVSNNKTTTNHNNNSTTNNINVYGTNAQSTANAVKNKITGISIRNMQGVTY